MCFLVKKMAHITLFYHLHASLSQESHLNKLKSQVTPRHWSMSIGICVLMQRKPLHGCAWWWCLSNEIFNCFCENAGCVCLHFNSSLASQRVTDLWLFWDEIFDKNNVWLRWRSVLPSPRVKKHQPQHTHTGKWKHHACTTTVRGWQLMLMWQLEWWSLYRPSLRQRRVIQADANYHHYFVIQKICLDHSQCTSTTYPSLELLKWRWSLNWCHIECLSKKVNRFHNLPCGLPSSLRYSIYFAF